jgi:hypothetical protein
VDLSGVEWSWVQLRRVVYVLSGVLSGILSLVLSGGLSEVEERKVEY